MGRPRAAPVIRSDLTDRVGHVVEARRPRCIPSNRLVRVVDWRALCRRDHVRQTALTETPPHDAFDAAGAAGRLVGWTVEIRFDRMQSRLQLTADNIQVHGEPFPPQSEGDTVETPFVVPDLA